MPPPLIYLDGLLLGLAVDGAFARPFLSKAASRAFGLPLLVGGVSPAGWFGRAMRRVGTPFRLDEPFTTLVTDGTFRYRRNPDYLSFAMGQAGLDLLANGSRSVALVPAALIQGRILERKEYLERFWRRVPVLRGVSHWVPAEIPSSP